MIFRITVRFGAFCFCADCSSVAAAFRHCEALFFSPMYDGTKEERENACSELLLILSEIARGRRENIENGFFRVDGIKRGRRL